MDRFKFRVWDGDRYNTEILNWSLYQDGRLCFQGGPLFGHPEVVVEQCTGLKDKHGELIYEGDIVRFECEDLYTGYLVNPVVYHQELCMWGFPVTVGGSYKHPIGNYPNGLFQTDGDIEIIGNIHTNPELLEQP